MGEYGLFPDHGSSAFRMARNSRAIIDRVEEVNPPKEAALKEAKAPLEHWHHDLDTISILLDEHRPDVRRAADLIQEIQREMERWMRH